jgi:pSer/pThr/pTyr-binding forkhead associated (FHA) protein
MKIKVLHSETQAEVKELNLAHVIAEGESCFVGRSDNSGLTLEGPSVSRLHGKFSRRDGLYYFCDMGSSNGSMVKGELATANRDYQLEAGDVIRVGDYVLLLEAVPELPEELAATVVGNLDTTVVAGYGALPDFSSTLSTESEEAESAQVVEAEIVPEESLAIVRVEPQDPEGELSTQTAALFSAINRRVVSELKAAGNLTRDTYLNAIRKARESVEQNKLVDPEQFEQNAEKYWQSLTKGTSNLGSRIGAATVQGASELGSRLNAAAKAAFREFLAPKPKTDKLSDNSQTEAITDEVVPGGEPDVAELEDCPEEEEKGESADE